MAKKGTHKQANTSGKLELIQARGLNRVCVHGSIYCRICYGYNTVTFQKRKKD